LFNIGIGRRIRQDAAYLNPKGFAEKALERPCVARRRPELQLRVAGRPDLKQFVLAAVV